MKQKHCCCGQDGGEQLGPTLSLDYHTGRYGRSETCEKLNCVLDLKAGQRDQWYSKKRERKETALGKLDPDKTLPKIDQGSALN